MPFNKTKGQMGKWRSLGMKKDTANAENAKSGITVISSITGLKRKKTVKKHISRKYIINDIP